ncbi:Skp1 family dimerization domain [Carpediemonas membranifera]|uniref:Skp1 family dimerization domain n=1 Tax=Carpediemonas membranifera TaxID=201153 RepID=A0A8J6E0V2_9EUKA|nr:Skp1 family dimerization domain [Carpediemonas membranifera]|eukprot:KAG9392306.1 Skp1 family dimerization domain [Carpediemonas membranifera]
MAEDAGVIRIKLSDGEIVEYDKNRLIEESRFFADACAGSEGPHEIPVTTAIWGKIKSWLDVPRSDDNSEDSELRRFEKTMFNANNQPEIFGTMIASDFLQMDLLTDAGIDFVANMMRGKTPKELRRLFNIPMDWSPSEISELKEKYPFLKDSDVFDPVD